MIDMDAAASAADYLEAALSSYRGSAANWESAKEYVHVSSGANADGLVLSSVIPLPTAFVAQYSNFQYKSFMGLFPEIGRAWLTADTRLYLWSYGEDRILRGTPAAEDFYAYEAFDQIIVSVALVRPRPAVFIDDIEYLVAVATPVEVTLLGVTFSGNGYSGEISLIPTNISVATDGFTMLKIESASDGRIFMAGSDGNLHEFVYYGEQSGWARALLGQRAMKRPRKLVHKSSSLINYVIPKAVKEYFSKTDELVDIAVDCDWNALYTLSSSGCLSVYDISCADTACLVRSVDVAAQSKTYTYLLPSTEREYIAIFAVPQQVSSTVHLVVLTSLGERIYFSTSSSRLAIRDLSRGSWGDAVDCENTLGIAGNHELGTSSSSSSTVAVRTKRQASWESTNRTHLASKVIRNAPAGLRCVGYRGVPVQDDGIPSNRPCFHMAHWVSGAVILSDLRQNDHDHLFAIFPHASGGNGGLHGSITAPAREDGTMNSSSPYNAAGSTSTTSVPPDLNLSTFGYGRPAESVHGLSLGGAARNAVIAGGYGMNDSRSPPPSDDGNLFGTGGSRQFVRTFAIAEARIPTGGIVTSRADLLPRGYINSQVQADFNSHNIMPVLETPSMFWVLTSSAMLLYARVSPKQKLAEVIGSSNASERQIESFFLYHGTPEACSICVDLATSDRSLAPVAARILYTHGGHYPNRPDHLQQGGLQSNSDGGHDLSGYGTNISGRTPASATRRPHTAGSTGGRQGSGFDIGRPCLLSVQPPMFSNVHDGICTYMAKQLQSVWNQYLCSSQDPNGYQQLAFEPQQLKAIQEELKSLVSFLDQYDPDDFLPFDEEEGNVPKESRESSKSGGHFLRHSREDIHAHHNNLDFSAGGQGGLHHHNSYTSFGGSTARHVPERGQSRGQSSQAKKSSDLRRAEVGAIQNLKQLALRCVEALSFLSILLDHQLHRIVPALESSVRETFVRMQFCDLVARFPGASVSAALIEVLFRGNSAVGNDLSPLSKLLQSRCGSYFDDEDMILQGGLQRIRAANELLGVSRVVEVSTLYSDPISTGKDLPWNPTLLQGVAYADRMEAQRLVDEAVGLLKPLASRIYNLQSLCTQLARTGSLAAAVDLALSVGNAADLGADSEKATSAYTAALDLIEPVILFESSESGYVPSVAVVSESESPPSCVANGLKSKPNDVQEKKDAAMRVALQSGSDRFHDMLYSRMAKSKQGERELLLRPSASVEHFLRSHERRDLLWRYYSHHARYADAAGVLVAMAEDDECRCSLLDRLGYLSRALHNAKTAVSTGDMHASGLETDIKDFMDVARVQLRLRDELSRRKNPNQDLEGPMAELDSKVFDLTVLYNEYALPYELLESTLDILRCGSYRDDEQVRELWMKIIGNEIEETKVPSLLQQRVIALGHDLFPSDVAFPTRFLVDLLERQAYERRNEISWSSASSDWVFQTMSTVGVPLCDIVDAYRCMIESTGVTGGSAISRLWSWTDESSQLHVIGRAEMVCSRWAEQVGGKVGLHDIDRRAVISDLEKIRRVVALCKSRLRAMSNPSAQLLTQKFDALDTSLFAAT